MAVLALAVLVANDHVLKRAFPGWATGKASDLAGLVIVPLLLVALVEIVGRQVGVSRTAIVTVTCVTGLIFAVVKVAPPVADLYSHALGVAMWPIRMAASGGRVSGAFAARPVRVLSDPGDLVTLPALGLAVLIAQRRCCTTVSSAGGERDPEAGIEGLGALP